MGLHALGVDDGVRATSAGHLSDVVTEVALHDAVEVNGLGPGVGHPGEPLGDQVDGDRADPAVNSDPAGHVFDRSCAEHHEGVAGAHPGVLDGLPSRWQHVGQVQEAVVCRPLRHLDRPVVPCGTGRYSA